MFKYVNHCLAYQFCNHCRNRQEISFILQPEEEREEKKGGKGHRALQPYSLTGARCVCVCMRLCLSVCVCVCVCVCAYMRASLSQEPATTTHTMTAGCLT